MLPRIRLPFRGWSMATKRLDRMGYLAEGDDGWPLDPGTDARRGLDPASGRLILVAAGCGPSYGPIFESSVQSASWPTHGPIPRTDFRAMHHAVNEGGALCHDPPA